MLAFAEAPFVHFHEHDPDHDHDHGAAAGRDPDDDGGHHIEAADHDADACYCDWFAGDGTSAAKNTIDFACVPAPFTLVRLAGVLRPPVPQNHDPPPFVLLPARAPPAVHHL